MTPQEIWSRVDEYVSTVYGLDDSSLTAALRRSRGHGLPEIHVSECQGQLLLVLAKALRVRRILEIGTLGGFSTIFLARALAEDGRVYSLELDPKHAEVARENLTEVGLGERVDVIVGDAHESLAAMISDGVAPFDLVFLDAEKPGYPAYLDAVVELSRPGTLIVADNVVRGGAVLEPDSDDPNVRGVREFHALVAANARLTATVLQTVGTKGYDGLTVAVVG